MAKWLPLGTIRPTDLVAARLELHWAVQLPAAVGIARAEPAEDFSQHALTFEVGHHALVSALVPGRRPYRVGLRLADGTLLLLNQQNSLVEVLQLEGKTLRDGLDWIDQASERYTGERGKPLVLPEHELPEHGLGKGAAFGSAEPAFRIELAHWFENLHPVLAALGAGRKASPPRVWSHHFDLDSVLALGNEHTLGLGFSPGDESYAEPYLYVLPTPYPEERALPPLAAPFEWVTDGWIGAVLRGSRLTPLAAEAQAELVEHFYRSAEDGLRRAFG